MVTLSGLRFYLFGILLSISLIAYSSPTIASAFDDSTIQLFRPFVGLSRNLGILLLVVSLLSGPFLALQKNISFLNNSRLLFLVCSLLAFRTLIGPLLRDSWSSADFVDVTVWLSIYFFLSFLRFCFKQDFLQSIIFIKKAILQFISLFLYTTFFLYILAPQVLVVEGRRFFGIFAHPNFAGVTYALFSVIILQELLYKLRFSSFKIVSFRSFLYLIPASFSLYFIFLTGSRTSFVSLVIALFFLNFKPKRLLFLVFLILVFYFLFFGSALFQNSSEPNDLYRTFSLYDTRSYAWLHLFQVGVDNFFLGVDNPGFSENSLLYLFAHGGILGFFALFIPVTLILFLSFSPMNYQYVQRLFFGFSPLCVIFVSSFFEGSLAKDLLSYPILIFMIYISLFDYGRTPSVSRLFALTKSTA